MKLSGNTILITGGGSGIGLPNFIDQTMQILQTQPTPSEICVENVKFLVTL